MKIEHCLFICFLILCTTSCLQENTKYDQYNSGVETYISTCTDTMSYEYYAIDNIDTTIKRPIAKTCNKDHVLNELFWGRHNANIYYNGSIINSNGYNVRMITFENQLHTVKEVSSYLVANHQKEKKTYIISCGVTEIDSDIKIKSSFKDNTLIVLKINTPDYDTGGKTVLYTHWLIDFPKNGNIMVLHENQADSLMKHNKKIKEAFDILIKEKQE